MVGRKVYDMPSIKRCPQCKSSQLQKSGKKVTRSGVKQRYQCQKCGHVFQVLPAVSINPKDFVDDKQEE